jgi:hypothetical protein
MLLQRLVTGYTPAHGGDVAVPFTPDHLGRGDQYINITFDASDLTSITKDGSDRIATQANAGSLRTFSRTMTSDANKPVWTADGIVYDNSVAQKAFEMSSMETTMDMHYMAGAFSVDWANSATDQIVFCNNGAAGSNGNSWFRFYQLEKINSTSGRIWVYVYSNGWHGLGFLVSDANKHTLVATVAGGVLYGSLDDGTVQSTGSNIRPYRNTAGTAGFSGSSSANALNFTEVLTRFGSPELTAAEMSKVHSWLSWDVLQNSGANLDAGSDYKSARATTLQSAINAEADRRAAFISVATEITPITPDESFSYQQTLAFTGDTPDGFTQTFESIPTAADVTHEADGAGPWYAPGHPPIPSLAALGGPNVVWAAYNDATAFQTVGGKLQMSSYRPVSGAAPVRACSIASMNHEGTEGFAQPHGVFEAKATFGTIGRTSAEPEVWPSFWLLSKESVFDRSCVYGEWDLVEGYSKDPGGLHITAHEHGPAFDGQPGGHFGSDVFQSNYIGAALSDGAKWALGVNGMFDGLPHIYTVWFNPLTGLIHSYFDRREAERRPYPSGMRTMEWKMLFWNMFHSVNVAGHDPTSTWMGPYPMTVDYARVFQHPDYV